jgi:hypothetical protein
VRQLPVFALLIAGARKSSIDELEGEELADLPEGFQDWPVDETSVN